MHTIVLVDADSIVYRVGFAAQQRVIHAVCEGEHGGPYRIRFEGRTDKKNYLAEHPRHVLLDEEEEVVVEPLPFALQTVKRIFDVLERLGTPKVYLTGKGNYRNALATIAPYKGNRDPAHRPVHYAAIREYLLSYRGAVLVNGCEADDAISIEAARLRQDKKKYVVATIDKDLDQIPGKHYDYAKHISYRVSPEDAKKWFWRQALSGDATDNIPGCWKVGKEKAAKLVDGWYLAGLSQPTIWDEICMEYEASTEKTGCPYQRPDLAALETARLVYMQRAPGELWNPPGIAFGKLKGDADE